MSIAFHHKINYKKLFESMLVGSSYLRHFESMLGTSYLREYQWLCPIVVVGLNAILPFIIKRKQ